MRQLEGLQDTAALTPSALCERETWPPTVPTSQSARTPISIPRFRPQPLSIRQSTVKSGRALWPHLRDVRY